MPASSASRRAAYSDAAIVAQEGFDHLDAPVTRVAAPDVPAMPFNHPQEDAFLPNPEKIAAAMRRLAAY